MRLAARLRCHIEEISSKGRTGPQSEPDGDAAGVYPLCCCRRDLASVLFRAIFLDVVLQLPPS